MIHRCTRIAATGLLFVLLSGTVFGHEISSPQVYCDFTISESRVAHPTGGFIFEPNLLVPGDGCVFYIELFDAGGIDVIDDEVGTFLFVSAPRVEAGKDYNDREALFLNFGGFDPDITYTSMRAWLRVEEIDAKGIHAILKMLFEGERVVVPLYFRYETPKEWFIQGE